MTPHSYAPFGTAREGLTLYTHSWFSVLQNAYLVAHDRSHLSALPVRTE